MMGAPVTQLLSPVSLWFLLLQSCITSTETVGAIRDGSPGHTAPELCVSVWFLRGESPGHTAPEVCLFLVSSSSVLLYVHRDRRGY